MGRNTDKHPVQVLIAAIILVVLLRGQSYAIEVPQTGGSSPKVAVQTETLEPPRSQMMVITGYCACRQCVGEWYTDNPIKYGASGRQLISGYSVATNSLPLGTIITIDGKEYRVDDRGTAGIDIYYDTHAGACSQGYSVKEVRW